MGHGNTKKTEKKEIRNKQRGDNGSLSKSLVINAHVDAA